MAVKYQFNYCEEKVMDKYSKVILTFIACLLAYDVFQQQVPEAFAANGLKKGMDLNSQRRVDPMPVVNCYRVGSAKPVVWSCGDIR